MMEISPLTCSAEELFTILQNSKVSWLRLSLANPAMSVQHIVALLRNHHVTEDIIRSIVERTDWMENHAVQFAVANCPRTPHTLGLRTLQLLHWNDLMKVAGNVKLSPRLRRSAENQLRDKVAELTPGEKMTLARTGPRAVIAFLRDEDDSRVIGALLRNPHLIEGDVLGIINNEFVDSQVLAAIGVDYKWSHTYPVRLALVKSPRTPLPLALSLVSKLRIQDLKTIASAEETPELIRRACDRILAGLY